MKKSLKITLLIILILVILGALSYFFVFNKENNQTTQNTEEIDTLNWKTYRNEELGFEFRYPDDWRDIILSFSESQNPDEKNIRLATFNNDGKVSFQGGEVFAIEPENNLDKNIEKLDDYITDGITGLEKIYLTNGVAFYFKSSNMVYDEIPAAYVVSDNYVFHFYMSNDNADSPPLEDLFKNIISTFKFE